MHTPPLVGYALRRFQLAKKKPASLVRPILMENKARALLLFLVKYTLTAEESVLAGSPSGKTSLTLPSKKIEQGNPPLHILVLRHRAGDLQRAGGEVGRTGHGIASVARLAGGRE